MSNRQPPRFRSKTTGRYVSEDFAREHPDETYAVNRRISPLLVCAVAAGLLGAVVAAGIYYRRQGR
jgi:hypothetical protein